MPIGPGGLDEQTPHVAVAGLGDRAPRLLGAAGMLARHQPQIGHELRGAREAMQIPDLRDHRRGAESRLMPRNAISASITGQNTDSRAI